MSAHSMSGGTRFRRGGKRRFTGGFQKTTVRLRFPARWSSSRRDRNRKEKNIERD